MRTFLALCFQGRIVKIIHQVVLADLPYLSATETTSTTWTSCDQLAHILLRVNSVLCGGMTVPLSDTGYERNSEVDMS